MLAAFFALLLLVPNQTTGRTDPLWHSYTPYPDKIPVDSAYVTLTMSTMVGTPIQFPHSNTSANYSSEHWFDPCFDRGLNYTARYVAFWSIGDDAYCTVHLYRNSGPAATLPFTVDKLARLEYLNTRCE